MHSNTTLPPKAAEMGRFPAISPHRGSIKCLVHACCSHVTLTDSRMNDLFGGLFNCQRWMASIGVLSLLMNQAICHLKQIYPHALVQAHPQKGLQGPCLLKNGLKMRKEKETGENWEIVKRAEPRSILQCIYPKPCTAPL